MQLQTALLLSYALGVYADIYNLAATIPWSPKTPSSVDQSVIYNSTYYLADRSNAGVHVIPLSSNNQTAFVTGFQTVSWYSQTAMRSMLVTVTGQSELSTSSATKSSPILAQDPRSVPMNSHTIHLQALSLPRMPTKYLHLCQSLTLKAAKSLAESISRVLVVLSNRDSIRTYQPSSSLSQI
jgi:hypothetical protein